MIPTTEPRRDVGCIHCDGENVLFALIIFLFDLLFLDFYGQLLWDHVPIWFDFVQKRLPYEYEGILRLILLELSENSRIMSC